MVHVTGLDPNSLSVVLSFLHAQEVGRGAH